MKHGIAVFGNPVFFYEWKSLWEYYVQGAVFIVVGLIYNKSP